MYTHSRMWVKENSGWSIVSAVEWMFRVLESSNVASMLQITVRESENTSRHVRTYAKADW